MVLLKLALTTVNDLKNQKEDTSMAVTNLFLIILYFICNIDKTNLPQMPPCLRMRCESFVYTFWKDATNWPV